MMKKTIFTSITITLMILISGCQEGETAIDSRIKTGTNGLSIEFINDIPYNAEAYENDQFVSALNLKNLGGYDIEDGYLAVIIQGPIEALSTSMGGTSAAFASSGDTLEGFGYGKASETKRVDLLFNAKEIALTKEQDAKIIAKACYRYQTTLVKEICTDPDIEEGTARKKACYYQKDTPVSGGQGAPVSITNIEFKRIPYGFDIRPIFRLSIQNNEQGSIIDENNAAGACTTGIEPRTLNRIRAEAKLGDDYLQCSQKDEDSGIFIECEGSNIPTGGSAGYQELEVNLYYGYITQQEKDIKVLRKEQIR